MLSAAAGLTLPAVADDLARLIVAFGVRRALVSLRACGAVLRVWAMPARLGWLRLGGVGFSLAAAAVLTSAGSLRLAAAGSSAGLRLLGLALP